MKMKTSKKVVSTVIILGLIIAILCILLTGCLGNMSIGLGNFDYKRVHINTDCCYEIEKWYDGNYGIEVKTKDYGSLFLSEGTYILVGESDCPLCNHQGE